MKKIILIFSVFLLTVGVLTAQVLPSGGVENTLSTTIGLPCGEAGDNGREGFHFYGFVDTLQIRVDISQFTIEGMLNWGALTKWKYNAGKKWVLGGFTFSNTHLTPFAYTNDWRQGGAQTNGSSESYYVNFLFHPAQNFDIGMGTRLDWVIGPAPSYGGMLWEPAAHIVQGGLKSAKPGDADAAGYIRYANCYARTALGARFKNDVFEVGVSIPSGATTDSFLTNFALGAAPAEWMYIGVAFEGIWKGDSNLYTGLSLKFRNDFGLDAYLAVNNIGGAKNNGLWGTGVAFTIGVPKAELTIRPELGFTFWEQTNYSLAWYSGIRTAIDLDRFTFGAWTSLAFGSYNKDWRDNKATENYTGGFVLDLRPDVSFKINEKHTLSSMFDFQYRRAFDRKRYNTWATSIYWTYKM